MRAYFYYPDFHFVTCFLHHLYSTVDKAVSKLDSGIMTLLEFEMFRVYYIGFKTLSILYSWHLCGLHIFLFKKCLSTYWDVFWLWIDDIESFFIKMLFFRGLKISRISISSVLLSYRNSMFFWLLQYWSEAGCMRERRYVIFCAIFIRYVLPRSSISNFYNDLCIFSILSTVWFFMYRSVFTVSM